MGEVKQVLDRAEQMMRASYAGLTQFENTEGEKKIYGLMNAVTCGRNVTWILQKGLRGKVDGFDEWYEPRQATLKEDPVCSQMVEIRNRIVKEGDTGVSSYASFSGSSSDILKDIPNWADSAFLGDETGGSGFIIERENGEEVKFYTDFSHPHVESGLYFEDLNDQGLDSSVSNVTNAEDDLRYYVKVIAELVRDAKEEFGERS